ncbi:MAG: CheR family methyltransferase [Bacteroidota bacterium]
MLKNKIPIIGIGASAGGLEPLEIFFNNANHIAGYAYVVIQHLAPNHKSLMDELLARHTSMPIKVIENGMEIEPNTVFLNPPKKFVSLLENKFILSDKEDKKLSFPITTFFQSLAEHNQEFSASIILSGTGSDGSEGIKFIKEKGGVVLVQNPESAKFDGMPKNAIHTGSVDKICQIEDLPKELDIFFNSNKKLNLVNFQTEENSLQLKKILNEVKNQTEIDFSDYKFSTMYRRTVRRMGLQGFTDLDKYLDYLKKNKSEGALLAKELLIGVTRFFRDIDTFNAIQEKVIPELIKQTSETKNIRVWVPACSSGEEAYSIAILIKDYLKKNQLQYDVKIFATDLDVDAIKAASNPIFPENIANEISPAILNAYFIHQKDGYKIAKEIRDLIVFSVHNIIQDPPFSKIDLLSCRNFLIYLNSDIQKHLFSLFQFTLKSDGFLILGSSESIGEKENQFDEFDKKNRIFRNKKNQKVLKPIKKSGNDKSIRMKMTSAQTRDNSDSDAQSFTSSPKKVVENITDYLIQEYVPDAVIFNEYFELVHTTGKTNQWLKLPLGVVSINILRMLPEDLSLTFEMAANKLIQEDKEVSLKNAEITQEMQNIYGAKFLNIHFKKIESDDGSLLIIALFENQKSKKKPDKTASIDLDLASKEKISVLEKELKANKENLQTTVEELESSNEELQASNEELQSSNEELESVNEELYTVNAEFQEKVEELTDANNDLNNLIHSTNIAILFLDSELNIRKFTPAIKDILNLMPHDEGRHISHFRSRFQIENFTDKIEGVHRDLKPFETSIQDPNDRQFMMRVTPFRTDKNEIKGIVISFVEITPYFQVKNTVELSEKALDKINQDFETPTELFKLIVNHSTEMISLHDLEGNIEYVSPAAKEILGVSPQSLNSVHPYKFIKNKEHQKAWQNAFDKIKEGKTYGNIQVEFITGKNSSKWLEIRFKAVNNDSGELIKILASSKDVSRRVFFEEEIQKLSLIAKQTKYAVIITDLDGKINYVNESFLKLTNYKESYVLGKKPGDFLQGKDTDPKTVKIMSDAVKERKGFEVDIINYTKKGHKYWTNIQCELLYDRYQKPIGFFSIQSEISREKEFEVQIESLNQMLKSRNNKLTELNKSLEEFAYVASHDLKEPARNIKSILELILKKSEGILDDKLMNYMQMAASAGDKMNQMINSLLEYSRSGVLNEDLKTIDLKEALDELKFSLDHLIQENNVKIELNDNIESFKAYPILFGRLLQNLVQNAIKYRSDKKPKIVITATENEFYYIFSVADNGIGISQRNFERVFKIFQKAHNDDAESHGIGLAVCKKIVETHLGEMDIESQEGYGSVFHFTISKKLE